MKKIIILILFLMLGSQFLSGKANAQMMGNLKADNESLGELKKEVDKGKSLLESLNSKKINCKNLTKENFENIGEYYMEKSTGDTVRHNYMNQMMKNMMGERGEEEMHVSLGKQYSGCEESRFRGGGFPMMGFGMMQWGFPLFSIFFLLFNILVLIILVLVIIWLWQQIQKKK